MEKSEDDIPPPVTKEVKEDPVCTEKDLAEYNEESDYFEKGFSTVECTRVEPD